MTEATLSDDARALRHRVFRAMARGPDAPQPNVYRGYLPLRSAAKDAVEEYRAGFMTFMTSNWEGLSETFRLLEDAYSKNLFVDLLAFRAIGQNNVDLFPDREFYFAALRHSGSMPATASEFSKFPGGQLINQFEVEIGGKCHKIDCLRDNIFFSFMLKQYFFSKYGIEIKPSRGDHAIDAGACFGDTALSFSAAVGSSGCVYCFDPLDVHLQIIRSNLQRNGIDNVMVIPAGLGESNEDGTPVRNKVNPGFSAVENATKIPVHSIDALVEERVLARIDFIKMDIEGHELSALRGAENSIRRFLPKLAISLYHAWDDYIDIPRYIDGLNLGYRFYLENYTVSDGETVLYCVADPGACTTKSDRSRRLSSSDLTETINDLAGAIQNVDALQMLSESLDDAERRVRQIVTRRKKTRDEPFSEELGQPGSRPTRVRRTNRSGGSTSDGGQA